MLSKPKTIKGYEIGQVLGKGSYAIVYKCRKIETNEIFALKVFKQLKHNQPQKVKLQVSTVQHLNHPNIIKCHQSFEDESDSSKIYAVFEYCGRGNLSEYMEIQKQQRNKIPEHIAKSYIYKILDALIYMHQQRIAHRDLKLANILINEQYEIKLADFGLSKSYEEQDMLNTICGTPLTMAPEVLNKSKYTEKCDTWSFGVISYFLLYSNYPYSAKNSEALVKLIASSKGPQFPKNVEVSELAKDFLRECLTINPQKRPSVEDLICHKWFLQSNTESRIRTQFMKESMGDISKVIQIFNHLLKQWVNNEIAEMIKFTNLSEGKINSIAKGFQEFYPQEQMHLFLFYFFAIHKVNSLEKGSLKFMIQNKTFDIKNSSLKKLSQHNKHLLSLLKGKTKSLQPIDVKKCDKSYQLLLKFIVNQGCQYVETKDKKDLRKLKFFTTLLNFLNSTIQTSRIQMQQNSKSSNVNKQSQQQINTYIDNILTEDKLLRIINSEGNQIDINMYHQSSSQNQWSINYINEMRKFKDDETWSMVGEIVERTLNVTELIQKNQ